MQRLILGCGKHFVGGPDDVSVDIRPFDCVNVVHDLNVTPWPFEDGRFVHASAVHVVEHLDSLLSFMDEAWRVLTVGGTLYLETPLAGGDADLEWCDPTHRRCYRVHTFANYFTLEGVERFGYTQRAWGFIKLDVKDSTIIFHGFPIKV